MKPEDYNRLRGQSLTIMVMDIVREKHAAGEEVSAWGITKLTAERYQLTITQRKQLRERIYDLVRSLEASGLITCERRWNARTNGYIKLITPATPAPSCSETSAK